LFFYPCEAVKKNLIDHYHVDPEKLHRLNYYFSLVELTDYTNAKNDSVISFCGVGTVSDRKGTDLFIEVAKRVHLSNPAITFVWYGSFENEESEKHYRSMAIHADGGKIIDFGGSLSPEKLREKYASFDGLMLTSREDPYPLVVLEAAFNNKPSLVFEWGGGISEFVADCGWVVQDVETMANTILRLTKEELQNKGILARKKALDWHANKKRLSEQLNVLFS
jgi:glycosyltransferase involved in cell wall biosynthesis